MSQAVELGGPVLLKQGYMRVSNLYWSCYIILCIAYVNQVKTTFGWKKYYFRLLQDSLFAFRSHESKSPKDEVELYCAKTKDCSWEVLCLPLTYFQLSRCVSRGLGCFSSKRRIVLRYQRKKARLLPLSVKVAKSTDNGSMRYTTLQTWAELRNTAVLSLEVGFTFMTRENGDVFGL